MAKNRDWIQHGLLRDEYHDLRAKQRTLQDKGERLTQAQTDRLAWLYKEVG